MLQKIFESCKSKTVQHPPELPTTVPYDCQVCTGLVYILPAELWQWHTSLTILRRSEAWMKQQIFGPKYSHLKLELHSCAVCFCVLDSSSSDGKCVSVFVCVFVCTCLLFLFCMCLLDLYLFNCLFVCICSFV